MTKEERSEYQKFATYCMRNEIPVTHKKVSKKGRYKVTAIIYSLKDLTKEELFTVQLADINRRDSTITAGLEEFYNENCKEENDESENTEQNNDAAVD